MEVLIVFVVLAVWSLILSIVTFTQYRFLKNLTKGSSEKDLVKVLRRILEIQTINTKGLGELKKELDQVRAEGMGHVQKIGLVRFNPFRETGGDHSFSLAVLDGKNDGFVITGLHTRERTRMYLKWLENGKSESELSAEETKAYIKAQKA